VGAGAGVGGGRASQREIAARLGINGRTVARLAAADEPPRYRRTPIGSQLDPLEPVLWRLLEEWPQMMEPRLTEILREEYGYAGSVRLVQAYVQRLRPRAVRPAQGTGYRPGEVRRLDWAEMPTRPTVCGRERRGYGLVASVPYSGADRLFLARDDAGVVPGGARARAGVAWRVPREYVYDNLCARTSLAVRATR
jgi:hypothetical protein